MTCTTGKISNVRITNVTNDRVSFTTDSKLAGATDSSAIADKRTEGTFTCPIGDIWLTQGGTTEDGITIEPSVKLQVDAVGPLYLDDRSLQKPGASPQGSCVIRGFVKPLLKDEVAIPLKWPNCGGLDDESRLDLVPTGIRVVGYANGKPQGSVNLLDTTFALTSQDIDWQSATGITLQLTAKGFDAFQAPVSNDGKLTVWPTKIEVVGTPANGNGHPGVIDLRDQQSAWTVQRLRWDAPGTNVSVRATSRGFARFGIVSDRVRMAAELIMSLRRTNGKAFAAIQILWHEQQAMVSTQPDGFGPCTPDLTPVRELLAMLSGHQIAV
jgi:hypothetical protein